MAQDNISPTPSKGGLGDKFKPQGQTAGPYGSDPAVDAKGAANKPARPLKP